MGVPIVIITDCYDENAQMRQIGRIASFMPAIGNIAFCGVNSTLEAGGNIIDALDSFASRSGLVLVNVAPRGVKEQDARWNGSQFGYLWVNNSLVFGTIDGYTFSFLQKVLGRKLRINVLDIADIAGKRVADSQFRSFEFMPKIALRIFQGIQLPVKDSVSEIPILPGAVWWVDNFGNLKTTLLPREARFKPGRKLLVQTSRGNYGITCLEKLSQVPDRQLGIVVGSSGYGKRRWLEIVLQGGSASRNLWLTSGDKIVFA